MMNRALLASPVVLIVAAACAGARPPVTASLPAPLVTALLTDRGGATRPAPDYVVGSLPPRYPAMFVPSGPVTTIGGMTNGDEIVAVFADSTRRLSAVLEELFDHAGFTRPAPSPGSGFSGRGGQSNYFCRDSATVAAEPLTGSSRNYVRVNYRVLRGQRACPSVDAVSAAHGLLHLPELKPPAGIRVAGSHGGASGSESISSAADLTGTGLVASVVVAHYAAQLTAAGWTGSAPAVSERVAAQYFEAKDASGATWEGVLMAVSNASGMTASLAMHVRGKP